METMNIHFFRNRNSAPEKLDYQNILEFFDALPNFETYYTENYIDDYTEIVYKNPLFNFSYRYLITKKSRVSNISKLEKSSMYLNINFLLEMPIMISNYLAREIQEVVQKLCKIFKLGYYHDSFREVKEYNVVEFLAFFAKQREERIKDVGIGEKVLIDGEQLNDICKYQSATESLRDNYHGEVAAELCYPIFDLTDKESGMCMNWHLATPALFAPHLKYINVIDDEGKATLVRANDLYNIIGRYLAIISNFLKDMYILKKNHAKKTRRDIKKIKKAALIKNYKPLSLADAIDKSENYE